MEYDRWTMPAYIYVGQGNCDVMAETAEEAIAMLADIRNRAAFSLPLPLIKIFAFMVWTV